MTLPIPALRLSKPLSRVSIMPGDAGFAASAAINQPAGRASAADAAQLQQQKNMYLDLCHTLQQTIAKLNSLYDEIFAGHNEAIARLSVEIARKVLMRNINDGDYEIEAIVKEALQNAPENTELKIRLNPADIETIHNLQTSEEAVFENTELVPDHAVGRGECVIESPKGIINVLIDAHLEQIANALMKTGGQ